MRYVMILAFVMAAILPYPASAGVSLQDVATGMEIIQVLGNMADGGREHSRQPSTAVPNYPAADPNAPVVVIHQDSITYTGTHSWWLQQRFQAELQHKFGNAGIVRFSVLGRDFQTVTDIQDQVTCSGRYDLSCGNPTAPGGMTPPELLYKATLTADLNYKDVNLSLSANSHGTVRIRKAKATVSIILQPIDLYKGLQVESYKSYGEEMATIYFDVNGNAGFIYGNYSNSQSDAESQLMSKALDAALTDLVHQAAVRPAVPALQQVQSKSPQPANMQPDLVATGTVNFWCVRSRQSEPELFVTVSLKPGKTVAKGHGIVFCRQDREIAGFAVAMVVDGHNVVIVPRDAASQTYAPEKGDTLNILY